MKTEIDDKNDEIINEENGKSFDSKKIDEPMPVEEDSILEAATKIEDSIAESDVEVSEITETVIIGTENRKCDGSLINIEPINKNDDLNVSTNDHLNSSEPMECASVNSMASPKHTMTTDVIMAESISVCSSQLFFI